MLVQYGKPLAINPDLVAQFRSGGSEKRAAVDELMLQTLDALGRVVTTGGTWNELRVFWTLRDLYVPSEMMIQMTTAEQVSLSQAFALDYPRVRSDHRVDRLMRRVKEYSETLRSSSLTGRLCVWNLHLVGQTSPARLLVMLTWQFLGLFGLWLLWLPIDLSLLPIYICMELFARRMSKHALQKSTVKIAAKDTVGTYKLIIGVPAYLAQLTIYTAVVHVAFGRTASVAALFVLPLLQYIAFKAQSFEWERWANLRTLLLTILRPGARDDLARERESLKMTVRALVDELNWGSGQQQPGSDFYSTLRDLSDVNMSGTLRRSKSIFLTSLKSRGGTFPSDMSLGLLSKNFEEDVTQDLESSTELDLGSGRR